MAGEEPAFLPVGTDVSAKYRGAFCEAKVKIIKKLVKCKINFIDAPNAVVPDDNIRGNLKVGAVVEAKHPETDIWTKGTILKLTDASTYTVVFDDGDEKTLRRTSLCLQGERHFNESETLDHLPLTDPENFGTPVMRESHSKKKRRLSTRSQGDDDDDDDDEESDGEASSRVSRKDDRDDSIGKVIVVETNDKRKNSWFPALVVDPTTAKDIQPKSKDHVVARSFKDNRYYSVDKQNRRAFAHRDHNYKGDLSTLKTAVEKAVHFVETGQLPSNWDAEILKRNRGASGTKKGKSDGGKGEMEEDDEEESEDESDDEYDEEKDAWLASLHKFMEERGTPINKPPVLGFRDLNLYKLYKLVQDLGGCRKVTDKQKWRYVATKMGIPAVTTSQPYNIKAAYNKYLYAFEDYNRKLGPGITRSLPRTRRRSSYGEHWPIPTLPVLSKIEKMPPQSKKTQESDSEENVPVTSPRSRKKVSKKSDAKIEKDTPDKRDAKTKEKERKEEEKLKEKREKEKREKEREREKEQEMEKERQKEKEQEEQEKEKQREKEKAEEERKEKDKKEKEREKSAKDKKEKKEDREKDTEHKQKRQKDREKDAKRRRDSKTLEGPGKKEEETESGMDKQEQKSDLSPSIKADFEIGEKIKVQYGRGRTQKIYEAKIVDHEVDGGKVVYAIHYMGWNVRFDEVITGDRILGWAEKKRERQLKEREKQQREKELEAERKEKEENERREKERVKREQEKAREKEQKDREKKEREAKEKKQREAKEKEDTEQKELEEAERKEQESKLKKTEKEQETEKVSEDKAEDKKSKSLGKRGRPSTTKTPTPTTTPVTPPTTVPGRSTPPHERSTSRSPVSSRSYPTRARRSDRRSLSDSPFASGLPTKSRPRRSSGYSEGPTKSERSWSDSENDELEDNSSQESEILEIKQDESSTTEGDKAKTNLESTVSRPQEVPGKIEDGSTEVTKDKKVEEQVLAEKEETQEQKETEDVQDALPAIVEERRKNGVEKAEVVEEDTAKENEDSKPPNLTPQKELPVQSEETSKKKEKKDKKESKKEAKSRSKKEGKAKKDQSRQSSGDAKKETKGKKDGKKSSQPKVDHKEESSLSREEPPKERKEQESRKELVPVEPEEEGKKRKGRKRRRRRSQEGRSKVDEGKEESLAEPQEKKRKDPNQKHSKKAEVTKPDAKQEPSSKDDSVEAENVESAKALSEPSSSCGSGKTFTYKGRPLLSTPPTSPENSPAAPSSPAAQEPAKGSVHEADDEHVSGKSDSDAMIEVASVGESSQGPRRHSPHHDASSSTSSADISTAHPLPTSAEIRMVKPDSGDNISPKKRKRNTSESEPTRKRSRKRSRRQSSVASSVAERRRASTKDVPRNSSSDTDETHSDLKHSHSSHRTEGCDPDRRPSETLSKISSSSSASKMEGQPVQRKWNFLIDVSHIKDPEERIALIQRQLNDLRKIYMQLKTEVATIDRRRKKFRRKEREAAAAAAALANQKQPSEKKSTDST